MIYSIIILLICCIILGYINTSESWASLTRPPKGWSQYKGVRIKMYKNNLK